MQSKHRASSRLILAAALCAAMYLCAAPLPARAENLTLVRPADQLHLAPAPASAPAAPAPQTRLAVDDDGNVMVRFDRMSLTFIYDNGAAPQDNRPRPSVPRQDVASVGGLSVKFGVKF